LIYKVLAHHSQHFLSKLARLHSQPHQDIHLHTQPQVQELAAQIQISQLEIFGLQMQRTQQQQSAQASFTFQL
jgi:hypothetical protein